MLVSKKTLVVFFFLVISFTVKSEKQFDYFRLNLVWPNSYCAMTNVRKCKKPIPQGFKVHGFWPLKANHMHAQPRTGFYFSQSNAKSWNFSSILPTVWPNLIEGRDDKYLWQWEWNKYGVRSGMSSENYFYLCVKYAQKYENLYPLLESGIIVPSDQPYEREILRDEITKVVASSPMITCKEHKKLKYLMFVSICIDDKDVAFNCPRSFENCERNKLVLFTPRQETISSSRTNQDMLEISPSLQSGLREFDDPEI